MNFLDTRQQQLLVEASAFYPGHSAAVGVLLLPGEDAPLYLKSGIHGGPFGGTHRGGVPRGKGWAFTSGGPSQGNIATHVEGHAVAILWQRSIQQAVLLVDRPMCSVCSHNLPQTMDVGMKLTVISEEEGTTHIWSSHGA